MQRTTRKVRKKEGWEDRINAFLTGDDGKAVTVKVDVVPYNQDKLIQHRLENVIDFEPLDFYMPLTILLAIFILNMLHFSGLFIIALQVILVKDLFKRVRRRPSGKKAVGLVEPYENSWWGWSFMVYFLCSPFLFGLAWFERFLFSKLFQSFSPDVRQMLPDMSGSIGTALVAMGLMVVVVLFVSVVLFAPLTEEIWFRGIGLTGLMQKYHSPFKAVLITSLIFGVLHGPGRILFTVAFGFVLSLIRFRTGSLYICMVIHAVHNFIALAYAFILVVRQFT